MAASASRQRRRKAVVLFLMVAWSAVSANIIGRTENWSLEPSPHESFERDDLTSSTFLTSTLATRANGAVPWGTRFPPSSGSVQKQKPKRGKITFDLRGTSFSISTVAPQLTAANETTIALKQQSNPLLDEPDQVSMSTDPVSAIHLIGLLSGFSVNFCAAFLGTLRFLAPLILSRRALNACGDLCMDYMRGRYIRKTYSRLERLYMNYYELPAAFRATCRTVSQFAILTVLSGIMGWMVGLHSAPCSIDGACPRMWCALLWIIAVVGTGHALASACALWGGPLRVQVAASHWHNGQSRVFTRPWHIVQWMQDPEQWISMISAPQTSIQQPFQPNPLFYPSTWVPLRFLQMFAVAKAAASTGDWSSEHNPVRRIMWSLLVEIALADEWYRVFIVERRVGLAACVCLVYLISSVSLVITAATMDNAAAIMLIPTFLAVSVSGWMNLVIFWNRLEARSKEAAVNRFQVRRLAALRALKFEY